MSDLRIYELEDIVWEIGDNDGHIVPHPGGKKSELLADNDSIKRPRLEQKFTESNADNRSTSDNAVQLQEGADSILLNEEREKMLDNSPQNHSSSGGFSASLDLDCNGKNMCSTSDGQRTFDQCLKSSDMDPTCHGLCANDPILDNQAISVDNNLYQYELNNAAHAEGDLGFFGSSIDDKESHDLLYYGWSEIENFEDVDRMFRNCDSTFGLDIDNDDELGWFSSSHAIEGSNDAAKPSFHFSGCGASGLDSLNEQQGVYGLNIDGLVADESVGKLTPVNCRRSSNKLTANGNPTIMNDSCVVSGTDSESQVLSHVSHPKNKKSSEGKRKESPSDNCVSFINFDNLKQAADPNYSLNFQCEYSSENEQKEASHGTCVQMPISLVNPSNSHSSNEGMRSVTSSVIKTEDTGLPSISPRESSHGSSQMQSVESSQDVSLQNPSVFRNKKRDRPVQQRRLSGHPDRGNLMVQRAKPDPVCAQKLSDYKNEAKFQSEVDGDIGIATEIDSSNIQESSCMSSVLDEVSIDASSFQQLQTVMGKLDMRTKLCIRDSLYRLARSAGERRHKCVDPIGGDKDHNDTSGALLSDGTNKCTDFMDMETDTNPIDRSIAHLLFHRPSDLSAKAPFSSLPVKSHTTGQAHDDSSMMAEKLICQEEITSANGEATEN